jgi:hypothetical protein
MRHRRTRHVFVSPDPISDGLTRPARPEQVAIGRLAHEILTGAFTFETSKLCDLFRGKLEPRGYVTKAGSIRWRLADDLSNFYGKAYLDSIQSSTGSDGPGWLAPLLRCPTRVQAPVRYLLVMVFLDLGITDYFSGAADGAVEPPLQSKTWKAKPVAWTQEMDHRLSVEWSDQTVSLCQISRNFSLDPMTIKRRAAKLGLPFPRAAKRPTRNRPELRRAVTRHDAGPEHRRKWATLWRQNPRALRKRLRKLAPATFVWLYRNDRQWLEVHQPPVCPVRGRPGRQVDWLSRDGLLSTRAEEKISELLASNFGGRVTPHEVARQLHSASLISRKSKRLPKTIAVLTKRCESRESFAVRRIRSEGPDLRLRSDLLKSKRVITALQQAGL